MRRARRAVSGNRPPFWRTQPEKYHPEIDTGVHTLQVLDVARELSAETTVRFAALVHDLGKGATPPAQWPRHIGHDHSGVAIIGSSASA